MPYTTNPATSEYDPTEVDLPSHLDHKPVFALPYEAFDGDRPDGTDVKFLSVGMAQWDPYEVSIKTMRYTGEKWTRQAEELPLNRPIDMTLFLAKVIFDAPNETVVFDKGTFHNQTKSDIRVTMEAVSRGGYDAAVGRCKPLLKTRLNALLEVLNGLKAEGKI